MAQCDGFTASDLRRIVNDAKVDAAQRREQDPKAQIDGAKVARGRLLQIQRRCKAFKESTTWLTPERIL